MISPNAVVISASAMPEATAAGSAIGPSLPSRRNDSMIPDTVPRIPSIGAAVIAADRNAEYRSSAGRARSTASKASASEGSSADSPAISINSNATDPKTDRSDSANARAPLQSARRAFLRIFDASVRPFPDSNRAQNTARSRMNASDTTLNASRGHMTTPPASNTDTIDAGIMPGS